MQKKKNKKKPKKKKPKNKDKIVHSLRNHQE